VRSPIAVDGALHLRGSFEHGQQGIGHRTAAVVVRVDADLRSGQMLAHGTRGRGDFMRQASAIGLAEDEALRAGFVRGLQHGKRIGVVFEVSVKEVLGVEEYAAALRLEITHGFAHDGEVLFQRHPQDLGGVDHGGLREDRDHFGACAEQRLDVAVVLHRVLGIAGRSECRHLRVLEIEILRAFEKLHCLGIGTGLSAFDVADAEFIQQAHQGNLVIRTEFDAGTLCAIAQGGVIHFDALRHDTYLRQPRGRAAVDCALSFAT